MVRVGWQNCCQGLKAAASTSKISHMTTDVFHDEANLHIHKEGGAAASKSS